MGKLYAIHAYEDHFQGLHGVEEYEVIEACNDEEAEQYANEMAEAVIDSYGYMWDEDDYDEFEEERLYEIYRLTEETNASLEELNDEWYNNPETFLEKYENTQIF